MDSRDCRSERGFTVVEALVAASVFMLIMFGAFSMYSANGAAFHRGQDRASIQQNARIALESVAREIRMAGYDHSGVLAGLAQPTPIQTATSASVVFVAELTGDNVLDRVTYQRSGAQLTRSIASWTGAAFGAASTSVIADEVATLSFSYFDAANAALAAPVAAGSLTNIRRLTIGLVTSQTTINSQVTYPLTIDVELRNP